MSLLLRDHVPANTTGSISIVAVSWVFPVLATFAVGGRFASRRVKKKGLGLDDWLILAALIPVWGHTAIILSSVYLGGIGHHEATLDPENAVVLFQTLTALQFSFGISLGLIKASICVLLMRIFITRTFIIAARIVLSFIICWVLMTILIGACICRPFALNWNPTLDGHCGDRPPAYISIAALDILGDVLIFLLPMPMIWNLHLSAASKVGLSFVFGLGFLDIIVGILRIVYVVALNTAQDYTWIAVNCWIWSVLEPSLAVIVACGPTLRPFFAACMGKAYRSLSRNKNPSYPDRRQQFSPMSDGQYPLGAMYRNHTAANGKPEVPQPGVLQFTDRLDPRNRSEKRDAGSHNVGIRVLTDVSVRTLPTDGLDKRCSIHDLIRGEELP